MHSRKFEFLKSQYEKGLLNEETLKNWVEFEKVCPGAGITKEEYEEITGIPYPEPQPEPPEPPQPEPEE